MVENAITKVARIAAHAAQGLVYKDSAGKEQTILPTGDKNMIDISGLSIGSNNGGDTGGGSNPDHPSSGADYYAGSLADGEITERKLLWQGSTDPTKTNNLTLLEDVGSKFNMAGDGAMYLVHIQKTAMTAGVKGATSDLQLNYDPSNAAKDGYFTTTSVYPIYISSSDLSTHQELVVPINGIGENLGSKNTKAPELHVTFKDDKTMDISTVTGYCNDGSDSGATGANYDIIVEVISTFSTQKAVAQLPASINLFTGASSGDVALAGSTDFYENVMDGLELTFSPTVSFQGDNGPEGNGFFNFKMADIGLGDPVRIPKKYLITGLQKNVFDTTKFKSLIVGENQRTHWGDKISGIKSNLVTFKRGSIKIDVSLTRGPHYGNDANTQTTYELPLKVVKVTPYKN